VEEGYTQGRWDLYWDQPLWSLIEDTMKLALQAEQSTGLPQTELLDELNTIISGFRPRNSGKDAPHWSSHLHSADQTCSQCPTSFLEFAVSHGLTLFVKNKINSGILYQRREERSLLESAIWHRPWYEKKPYTIQPAMVAMLLRVGCDPNEYTNG